MRLRKLTALVPLVLLPFAVAVLTSGAAAAADPPSVPIMPHQYFNGLVNGKTDNAVVYTACPGPATGQSGHPISGQTLSVAPASSTGSATGLGYTGAVGNSIAAAPVTSTANDPVVFTEYYRDAALPTSWTVPCDGAGRIAFTPLPGSSTAKTDYVTVSFINIAV